MAKKSFIVAAGRSLSLGVGADKVAGDKVSLDAAEGEALAAAGFVTPAKGGKSSSAKADEEAAAAAKAKADEEAAAAAKAKVDEEAAAAAKRAPAGKAGKSADLL